jgi:hypothetical protein
MEIARTDEDDPHPVTVADRKSEVSENFAEMFRRSSTEVRTR